jgi:hypothetical protein
VHASGAPKSYREVGLSLGQVARHDAIEQVEPALEELRSLRCPSRSRELVPRVREMSDSG